MATKKEFKVGDQVKLNAKLSRAEGDSGVATITALYKDIEGRVRLDRRVGGFYSWNVQDLVKSDG